MNPEDELCDKLTARIETAVAMGKSAREMAHSIMPIVLAYETRARADERAKVAAELYERAMQKLEGSSFRRHLIAAHQMVNPPTAEDAGRALQEIYEQQTGWQA